MRKYAAVALGLSILMGNGMAFAQPRPDYHPHPEWRQGYHMNQNDWGRGRHLDYRESHLNAPPAGYEWREVDGNYVMAAIATGVIANVIANAH